MDKIKDLDLDAMDQQLDEVVSYIDGELPREFVLALGAYRLALDNHTGGMIDPEQFFYLACDLCPEEHLSDFFFEMTESNLISAELYEKAIARLQRQNTHTETH
jgi:hypothetical protein